MLALRPQETPGHQDRIVCLPPIYNTGRIATTYYISYFYIVGYNVDIITDTENILKVSKMGKSRLYCMLGITAR